MAVNAGLDVARIKKDFPILEQEINGQRIVYLDSAATSQKPRAVLDAMERVLRDVQRERAPQRVPDRRRGDRGLRGGAAEGRSGSSTRRPNARSSSPRTPPRDQPRRVLVGPRQPPRRRRRRAHPDGAPRQHRAVAHPRGRARHRAALGAADPRRPARPHRPRRAARRRQGASGSRRCRTCSARSTRSVSSPTRRTPHGALAHRRRVPVRAARAHRRAGARRRLLRVLGPQDVRPDRHRRAVGPRGAARRDAAVPRRRRHDPRRAPRRLHAERAPVEVRGGHAAHRRSDRARRRGRLPDRARHDERAPARDVGHRLRDRTLTERFGDDITIFGPAQHRGARRRAVVRVPRPAPPRHLPDARQTNVCVRAGHHCAKPLMRGLGVAATARASFYIYNDEADVDALADGLDAATDFFTA